MQFFEMGDKAITMYRTMCLISATMMSWVRVWVDLIVCYLTDSEVFILFAENSQIFLKIPVIPIWVVNNIKSTQTQLIIVAEIRHT